jgi:hypothetical protein
VRHPRWGWQPKHLDPIGAPAGASSAKHDAGLLKASARLDGERVVLTLSDVSEHAVADPDVHQVLSDRLGFAVRAHRRLAPDGDVPGHVR